MNRPLAFDDQLAEIADVGGKGRSLMHLVHAGLDIPPGFVLPVAWFEEWLADVGGRVGFAGLATDPVATSAALKQAASTLEPTPHQHALLDEALARLPGDLLAVRSSSPDEDLQAASFAGGYASVLAVTRDTVWPAIRQVFTSCLDAGAAMYKQRLGLDPTRPRIAVIVQRLVPAEIAGVAFSIDPVTNDPAVVVINANWGLGESVVAGLATPDEIRVDKATRETMAYTIGDKEMAVRPRSNGGTEEYENQRTDIACLNEAQLRALLCELERVERYFGHPVDVEWAWADGRVHVLQARPVTALRR